MHVLVLSMTTYLMRINLFLYLFPTILYQALVNVDGYYTISFSRIKDKTYFI